MRDKEMESLERGLFISGVGLYFCLLCDIIGIVTSVRGVNSVDYIEILKIVISVGGIGVMAQFAANFFLATPIEKELETNLLRSVRWIFNFLLFVVVVTLYLGIIIYFADGVPGKEKILGFSKETTTLISNSALYCISLFSSFSLFVVFWYENYKRRAYIETIGDEDGERLGNEKYIVKRMTKEIVLVRFSENDKEKFKIFQLSDLADYTVVLETKDERSRRRQKEYYDLWHSRKIFLPSAFFLILIAIFWYFSEHKLTIFLTTASITVVVASYTIFQSWQYKRRKV